MLQRNTCRGASSALLLYPPSSKAKPRLVCRNISAVPIVDDDQRVIDLYHRFDVTFIALAGDAEQTMSNLNMRLSDLLGERRGEATRLSGSLPRCASAKAPA